MMHLLKILMPEIIPRAKYGENINVFASTSEYSLIFQASKRLSSGFVAT